MFCRENEHVLHSIKIRTAQWNSLPVLCLRGVQEVDTTGAVISTVPVTITNAADYMETVDGPGVRQKVIQLLSDEWHSANIADPLPPRVSLYGTAFLSNDCAQLCRVLS